VLRSGADGSGPAGDHAGVDAREQALEVPFPAGTVTHARLSSTVTGPGSPTRGRRDVRSRALREANYAASQAAGKPIALNVGSLPAVWL
jgi:hypothetical protein